MSDVNEWLDRVEHASPVVSEYARDDTVRLVRLCRAAVAHVRAGECLCGGWAHSGMCEWCDTGTDLDDAIAAIEAECAT